MTAGQLRHLACIRAAAGGPSPSHGKKRTQGSAPCVTSLLPTPSCAPVPGARLGCCRQGAHIPLLALPATSGKAPWHLFCPHRHLVSH